MTRVLPTELTGGQKQVVQLSTEEVAAARQAAAAVRSDLRFEHLARPDDEVWRFADECMCDRSADHVPGFVERHAREPQNATCYLPVEFLKVQDETELAGIRLLPTRDPRIPRPRVPWFSLDAPVGCVAAIAVRGTDYGQMAERARIAASHELRLLRSTLPSHQQHGDERQLRFRLGPAYAFDDQLAGWDRGPADAYEMNLGGDLSTVLVDPIMALPAEPGTDIERKALVALRWMERACMTGDTLAALLYRLFALEALLGRKSERLKAHGLAFRQMVLGHAVIGSFGHPTTTLLIYDKIRSGAVHGEDVPGVSSAIANGVEREVRRTVGQYLTFAQQHSLVKRSRLLSLLDNHPARSELIAWLREYGGVPWEPYLDELTTPGDDAGQEESDTAGT
jgi:hypothetical protein